MPVSNPKVSIIIPVYNTAKYMDECLSSVLGQTLKDIEIILVDDGSTDGVSDKLCDEYKQKDDRIKVLHKENGGLMSSWIAGVDLATAPYLCFVDSDDWIDTDMLEKLYAHTDSSFASSEIIAGNYIVEKAGERRKETQAAAPGEYKGDALIALRNNLLGNEVRPVTLSRCMKLISKELIQANIKYCNTAIVMGEDVNIMLPCLCDCERLYIAEGAHFYHYRLVGSSMVHAYNPKLIGNLELNDKTFRGILQDKKIESGNLQLDKEFVIMLLVVLKNELRSDAADTAGRVRKLFLQDDIRKKVMSTDVDITSKANKLLYACIRHPNRFIVSVAKLIINYYDKKTN
ncbi:glycosyltransferase family 2 protein [Butyrivibrio sp. INlla21]|uniref:glycosyltransferase family 2 protein n=1 Tax=Butyrivibrio sp. INlla21 TaxID=1520811 RepID=UPI0008EBD306|nr:glycosyltransferase family 2 protein [Butyrivibrio sp. INlla21]SFU99406.1 Glycosyl transferase family 2 [Butyrivibrio sp. INlla21]